MIHALAKRGVSSLRVSVYQAKHHNWLAIRKKGLSDICVKYRLESACAIRAG